MHINKDIVHQNGAVDFDSKQTNTVTKFIPTLSLG